MPGIVWMVVTLAGAQKLANNASFEQGAQGWQLPAGYEIVEGAARTGAKCLHLVRRDASVYTLASQPVPVEVGKVYAFRCRIKAKGVAGDDTGATLCTEWSGEKGWLGGAYPPGIRGDNDWVEVRGRTPPIPAETKRVTVILYIRKGMTGEAWFDDVVVEEYKPPAFRARISRPVYRGMFLPSGPVGGQVSVELAQWVLDAAGVYTLLIEPSEGQARRLALSRARLGPNNTLVLDFRKPSGRGPYSVRLSVRRGNELLQECSLEGSVEAAAPQIYADETGRLLVNGRRFFPLGFYSSGPDIADIELLKGTPFNCLMPYGLSSAAPERARPFLDAAERAGIKILYSLCWYLNDERPPDMHPELEARYRQVRALDREHPTWSVIAHIGSIAEYVDTCDILGSDPYPIPGKPYTMVSDWTRQTVAAAPERAVLMVSQLHDVSPYYGGAANSPTLEEARLMSYLALIEGADGLIFYSLFDLRRDKQRGWEKRWQEALELGNELAALVPALLSDDAPPEPIRVVPHEGSPLAHRVLAVGKNVFILLANPSEKDVDATVASGRRLPRRLDGAPLPLAALERGVYHLRVPPRGAFTLALAGEPER